MEVGRGNVSQKSLKGPAEKVPQHFSVCTRAIMHCICAYIWRVQIVPKRQHFWQASFWSRAHIAEIVHRRGLEEAEESVEQHVEGHLSLFCPRRIACYSLKRKMPLCSCAVLLPLHRLAEGVIYCWHRQCLHLLLSTLSMRTGRRGIASTSNVNTL